MNAEIKCLDLWELCLPEQYTQDGLLKNHMWEPITNIRDCKQANKQALWVYILTHYPNIYQHLLSCTTLLLGYSFDGVKGH